MDVTVMGDPRMADVENENLLRKFERTLSAKILPWSSCDITKYGKIVFENFPKKKIEKRFASESIFRKFGKGELWLDSHQTRIREGSEVLRFVRKGLTISESGIDTMGEVWKVHYWTTAFKGRAEFIRLLFEAAGVSYEMHGDPQWCVTNSDLRKPEGAESTVSYPTACPPVVTGPNGFVCSNTPAIMWGVSKKIGMDVDEKYEVHAMQVNTTCHDIIAEGRLAFHAKDPTGSYSTQKEECKPRIEHFANERLPKWLGHIENCLAASEDKGATYFFGQRLSYVDITVFHVLNASAVQFPEAFEKIEIPLLKAFKARMESLPRIKAYLESDRAPPFAGDSMM